MAPPGMCILGRFVASLMGHIRLSSRERFHPAWREQSSRLDAKKSCKVVHVTQFCVAQSRMQSSQSAAAAATKKAIKKKGKPATAQRPTVEHESSKIEDETPIEPPEEEARAPMPPPRKQPSFNLAARTGNVGVRVFGSTAGLGDGH